MLKLNCFYDLARLQAFDADADLFMNAVCDRTDGLQIRQETARGYTRYLLAYAAFTLGKAAADYGPSGNRFFTANFAYF